MSRFLQLDWQVAGATIIAWLLSFTKPIAPFLILITVLVLADLLVGILHTLSTGQEDKIQTTGLRMSIFKMFFYWIVILVSELIVITFSVKGFPLSPLTYMVSVLISYTEYRSILEKVEKATGTQIWNFLKHNVPVIRKLFPDKPGKE